MKTLYFSLVILLMTIVNAYPPKSIERYFKGVSVAVSKQVPTTTTTTTTTPDSHDESLLQEAKLSRDKKIELLVEKCKEFDSTVAYYSYKNEYDTEIDKLHCCKDTLHDGSIIMNENGEYECTIHNSNDEDECFTMIDVLRYVNIRSVFDEILLPPKQLQTTTTFIPTTPTSATKTTSEGIIQEARLSREKQVELLKQKCSEYDSTIVFYDYKDSFSFDITNRHCCKETFNEGIIVMNEEGEYECTVMNSIDTDECFAMISPLRSSFIRYILNDYPFTPSKTVSSRISTKAIPTSKTVPIYTSKTISHQTAKTVLTPDINDNPDMQNSRSRRIEKINELKEKCLKYDAEHVYYKYDDELDDDITDCYCGRNIRGQGFIVMNEAGEYECTLHNSKLNDQCFLKIYGLIIDNAYITN